jgi:hypothetical protein
MLGLLALCIGVTPGRRTDPYAYASATAEQLLQPYEYVHAVLGGRGQLIRLLPHPLLTPTLAGIWLLLNNSVAPGRSCSACCWAG